ncbi:PAS domain-containing sensor histidine kinase [Cystobacter fuscus]|uniref:histidine kinase n=1 Tax=Cystobacter fuscus TaxID=43 RepID=A0A250JBZ8_9BACT|nr:ATP-binding protein [Cystobacter fuscus]ATB40931.1 PAS domain-containing sensor histidine kinase [Cystobacter fuscus]
MADTQWSEARLEATDPANVSPDSPMLWLGGGLPPRLRWVSPSLSRALGHSLEECKARDFVQRLVHPEDLDRVLETWRRVLRTGGSCSVEFRAGTTRGRLVHLSVELSAVEVSADGGGELIGSVRVLVPAARPVFQSPSTTCPLLGETPEEVAQVLTRSEREHVELTDTVDGIVWSTDARFRFTFVSKQAERLLGYSTQRWMQEPDFWVKHLHPEDQDWAPAFCMKAAMECRAHEFEYRMIAADGRVVWLRDIVTVISEDGVPCELRGIMVDITEHRRAREYLEHMVSLLRATLESTADGVVVVDQRRRVTAYNRRFLELWRMSDEFTKDWDGEKMLRYALPQVQHPELFRERVEALRATPEKEGVDTIEMRDGRILERYSRPQRLGDTIIGRVWNYRDVTTERRAQAERERLLREAQEAIRVRDDFLSIASHELKTPLTPLKLHLQALRHKAVSGQLLLQHVEKTLAQVARLSGLINDLLDTSRIQAGRLELRHEPVPLQQLTREVLADLRPVGPHHTFVYEEPDETLIIQGDRGRLAQVLVNLLENAIKYSPTGGTIRLVVERHGAQALVSVTDKGIGIPSDQRAHLFERFFRARNAPISGFGGLGLGLYICRDIVERHGGRIWVESEVGSGSTFYFTLPVLEGAADAHAPLGP